MAIDRKLEDMLAYSIFYDQRIDVWDMNAAMAVVIERNVDSEQGYNDLLIEIPSGKPAVEPPTYTPKPPGDDTPQWIWDNYKNGGRTS
ncbi:hypothetical protein [Pseudomonas sp. URMO17WK12:I11]|uniref:hypothetical protein n=1 Tax=Pseudomonas sp. URMO17WK12:I11 TaxID=1283291 RepID=UPI00071EF8F8|nr:hypothetical protein [Pseudomonas sp. URMO17WK12:I11]CRL47265.1 hypothetical protein PSHI_02860 [Pseudomonas sp. URMO17WK12:I11]